MKIFRIMNIICKYNILPTKTGTEPPMKVLSIKKCPSFVAGDSARYSAITISKTLPQPDSEKAIVYLIYPLFLRDKILFEQTT